MDRNSYNPKIDGHNTLNIRQKTTYMDFLLQIKNKNGQNKTIYMKK